VNADPVPSDEVAAGAGVSRQRIDSLQDDDGTVLSGRQVKTWERRGSRYVRAGIKRTGGDAATRIRMLAMTASD